MPRRVSARDTARGLSWRKKLNRPCNRRNAIEKKAKEITERVGSILEYYFAGWDNYVMPIPRA